MNESTLPPWPSWNETPGWITITGRHRTSQTRRIASNATAWTALAWSVNCWSFGYSPLNQLLFKIVRAYKPNIKADDFFMCLALGGFFIGTFVVMGIAEPLYRILLRQKSSIRFSADRIEVPRRWLPGWRRFNLSGAESLEFVATGRQHVRAYQHTDQQGNVNSGVSAEDVYTVLMRFGRNPVPLGEFVDEDNAVAFVTVCQAAAEECVARRTGRGFPIMTAQAVDYPAQFCEQGVDALPGPTRPALGSSNKVSVRRRIG